jgi:hypothetical protein
MCTPAARAARMPHGGFQSSFTRNPEFAQQQELRRKPLTEQEKEQQRSQTASWVAMGNTAETSPYKILPRGRIEAMPKIPKMQRGMYGRP